MRLLGKRALVTGGSDGIGLAISEAFFARRRRCADRRIGQTSDLAGIAVYLASDEAAWTSGGIFAIDGGYTAG